MPRTYWKTPQDRKDACIRDLREGKDTYKVIAQRHGAGLSTVAKWAEDLGLRRQPRSYNRNWRLVRCLYEDDCTQAEIARRTRIPARSIGRWLRAHGFDTRRSYRRTPIQLILRCRDVLGLTWKEAAQHINNGINHATLRQQYKHWKLARNLPIVRSVGKDGNRKKCPQNTSSPRSKPLHSSKTSGKKSPTASSPNATP